MPLEPIGLIIIILGLAGLYLGETFMLYAFVVSTLLGSAAAIIIGPIGASIQPAHVMLGFFVLSTLNYHGRPGKFAAVIRVPSAGYWLTLAWVYGVAAAMVLPRLLAGRVDVNPIGVGAYGIGAGQVPLSPTSGHITQSVYFTGDLLCFMACSVVARTEAGFRVLYNAVNAYVIANILFALLDLATFWTGTAFILSFIRNATYVVYTDLTVNSMKRIIGSFTEASSFAYAAMGAFAFTTQLWLEGIDRKRSAFLSLASLALAGLSTSSTAYVVLPIYFFLLYLRCAFSVMVRHNAPVGYKLYLLLVPVVATFVYTAISLIPSAFDTLGDYFSTMVLQKSTSQSGIERGRYNAEAFQSFLQTFGLGAGIGSVRASSFVLAVLANMGILGGALYAIFIAMVLLKKPTGAIVQEKVAIIAAARAGLVILLITTTVSGALIDLGLPFFILAAMTSAYDGQKQLQAVSLNRSPTLELSLQNRFEE